MQVEYGLELDRAGDFDRVDVSDMCVGWYTHGRVSSIIYSSIMSLKIYFLRKRRLRSGQEGRISG